MQSGNFVKGQWPTKRPYNTSNSKPKLPQSNMIVQSDENDSESSDDGMVLTGGGDACQTGILAVQGRIAGKEVEDLIVDTGSAVSLVSSQFYETDANKAQLQPIKGHYMVANGSLLNIKGSVDLTVTFDKIEITHKFLCVDTKLSLALHGYDFLRKTNVDILTSANCLLFQNVPIISHMHKSRKTVGVIPTANFTIEPYSKNILDGQTEEQEAQLLSENSCILDPEVSIEDKLGVLIARGLVTPANSMPIRVLNVSNRFVNLKAEIKVGDLLPIEPTEQQLCLTTVIEEQKEPTISEIIDNSFKDEASMLAANEKDKLAKLILKYESIISRGSTDIESCKLLNHSIDTGDTIPIRMEPRRIPYCQQEEVQQDITAKKAAGIVRKSTSPWAFPIVVVRKKDGTARNCVDYSRLNDVTKTRTHFRESSTFLTRCAVRNTFPR